MALIPRQNRSPFSGFFGDDFFTDSLSRMRRGTDLAIDVYEKDDSTVAEMNIPGIDPENISVSVDRNQLTVSGSYEDTAENKDRNYTYRERRFGKFSRSVRLPQEVDADSTEASYHEGVLKITMPNQDTDKQTGKQITVTTS